MNARTDAAFAAVDADIANNPPTFPPLDHYPDDFGTQPGIGTRCIA